MNVTELSTKIGINMGNLSASGYDARPSYPYHQERRNVVYYRLVNPKMLNAFDILREILIEQIEKDGTLVDALEE